jgi:hypothetical protein
MTHQSDDDRPPEEQEAARRDGTGERRLDEDAAWRAIVENYGELELGPEPAPYPRPEPSVRPEPEPAGQDVDDEHYVPPDPPPLPRLDARRKLAWFGLLGCPLVMLIGAVLGVPYPGWLALLIALGFIGGFVYLVATLPRHRDDDWGGDDGAVI